MPISLLPPTILSVIAQTQAIFSKLSQYLGHYQNNLMRHEDILQYFFKLREINSIKVPQIFWEK